MDEFAEPRNALQIAQALWTLELGEAEKLPGLATRLLTDGYDSPALRELAGLAPFDPRDARDLFQKAQGELGLPAMGRAEAVGWVAYLWAQSLLQGRMTPRQTTSAFYRLAVATGYSHDPPEIYELYGLDDDWQLYDEAEVESDVRRAASALVARYRKAE